MSFSCLHFPGELLPGIRTAFPLLISIAAFLDFKKIKLPLLDHAKAGGEEAVPIVELPQTDELLA
jgi:hypothetical protein